MRSEATRKNFNTMMYPLIRCYHEGSPIPEFSFFILCKGENAGRPSFKPWTNSFIVACPRQEYFDFYFWLMYGLHQLGKFKPRLRGSVIPFINLEDVRDLIREVAPVIYPDWQKYQTILSALEKLEKRKATLAEQILATEKLQRYLLSSIFSPDKEKNKSLLSLF